MTDNQGEFSKKGFDFLIQTGRFMVFRHWNAHEVRPLIRCSFFAMTQNGIDDLNFFLSVVRGSCSFLFWLFRFSFFGKAF